MMVDLSLSISVCVVMSKRSFKDKRDNFFLLLITYIYEILNKQFKCMQEDDFLLLLFVVDNVCVPV